MEPDNELEMGSRLAQPRQKAVAVQKFSLICEIRPVALDAVTPLESRAADLIAQGITHFVSKVKNSISSFIDETIVNFFIVIVNDNSTLFFMQFLINAIF